MNPARAFAPGASRQAYLETVGVGEALRRLEDGLGAREPFLMLVGEPGVGKTALVHEAAARWSERAVVAFLGPSLAGAELLEDVVLRLGGEPPEGASRPKLAACLERRLGALASEGKVAVLVVDDAHRLAPSMLEELRALVDATHGASLEVLLVGVPALEATLEDAALAALRQRVSVRVRLQALGAGETRRYVRQRVDAAGDSGASRFPRQTCAEIAALSGGVPRRINALAGEALRLAIADNAPAVLPPHVRAAATNVWGAIPTPVAMADDADDRDEAPAQGPAKIAAEPPKAAPPPASANSTVGDTPSPPPRISAPAAAWAPEPPPAAVASARSASEPMRGKKPPKPTPSVTPPAIETSAAPVAPAAHDPEEWVKRFIGDDGPIQIGSKSMAASFGSLDFCDDTPAGAAEGEAGAPPKRRAPPRPRPVPRRRRRGSRRGLVGALAVIAIGAAVFMVMRSGGRVAGTPESSTPAAAEAPETPVLDLPATTTPKRKRTAAEAPAPVTAQTPPTPPAEPAASSEATRYSVEVGAMTDLQNAFDERDRAQELTGIESWTVPAEAEGGMHRVIVGAYRSRERAEACMRMLLNSRTYEQATVVPLPPRSARR